MKIKKVTMVGDAIVFEFDDKVGLEYPNRQSVLDMVADLEADDSLKRKQEISKWIEVNIDKHGGG